MIRRLVTKTLDASSRFTRTDMRYVIRGGGWMFAAEIIGSLSLAILALGYAHFLSPEVYGQYKFILAGYGIIAAFSLSELGTALMRSAARGFNSALRFSFSVGMRFALFASLASVGTSMYYFLQDNTTLGIAFGCMAIGVPFLLNFSLYNSFLIGKKQFALQTKYRIARILLFTGGMIFSIYYFETPLAIFLSYFGMSIFLSGVFYYLTARKLPKDGEIDEEILPYAKHLTFMSIIGRVTAHIDEILTFHYLGAAHLAVYAFALALPGQIKSFNGIIVNLIFPKLTEKSLPELRKILPYKIFLFVGAISIITGIYIFLAPFAYALFFPKYIAAVPYSQVFALTLVISAPTVFLAQVLLAHKQNKELYIVRIVIPIMKLILLIILIPLYGIWGAIFSLIGIQVLNLVLYTYFFLTI